MELGNISELVGVWDQFKVHRYLLEGGGGDEFQLVLKKFRHFY
jgi:hypothetical protein